jgi:hypothetical protein
VRYKRGFLLGFTEESGRRSKCAAFIRRLEDFRIRTADYETDRLLRYIYDETGFPGFAAAENPGADSRLLMLLDYARQFEEKATRACSASSRI